MCVPAITRLRESLPWTLQSAVVVMFFGSRLSGGFIPRSVYPQLSKFTIDTCTRRGDLAFHNGKQKIHSSSSVCFVSNFPSILSIHVYKVGISPFTTKNKKHVLFDQRFELLTHRNTRGRTRTARRVISAPGSRRFRVGPVDNLALVSCMRPRAWGA